MLKINVKKQFKSKRRSIDLHFECAFPANKIVAIYGHSGVGKSSLLRMIAGLEKPDLGNIQYHGKSWSSTEQKNFVAASKRNLGYLFQDYNLFPNMTVLQNLRYASIGKTISSDTQRLLEETGLIELANSYPSELSNGQRQRAAIIRALCPNPQLLLLDEPFSALDDEAITLLIRELKAIHKQNPMLIVFVTHRKDVIHQLADYIVEYNQQGTQTINVLTAQ